MNNIPEQQISGLDSNVLDWVSFQSSERCVNEISPEFLNYLNREEDPMTIEELTTEIIAEMNATEKESIPASTLKQMNETADRFKRFLAEKSLSTDLEGIPAQILNDYLRYFYMNLRTLDGHFYAPASLICIRAALHRYFLSIRSDINIIGDSKFIKSNRMLVTMIRKFKKSQQENRRDPYPVIETNDLKKMFGYFDRSSGEVLKREIMFQLIYHFGFRGRETLPHLKKTSFTIKTDSENRRYVTLNHELLSKNAKASLNGKERDDLKCARMYETEDPVQRFEIYMQKIMNISHDHLFPKPCKNDSKGLNQQK